jgi:hypothetical protein
LIRFAPAWHNTNASGGNNETNTTTSGLCQISLAELTKIESSLRLQPPLGFIAKKIHFIKLFIQIIFLFYAVLMEK